MIVKQTITGRLHLVVERKEDAELLCSTTLHALPAWGPVTGVTVVGARPKSG